jgi:ankyrin repeat protein
MLELPAALPWGELSACCMQQDGFACCQGPCSCCCSAQGSSSSSVAAPGAGRAQGCMAKVRSQLHRNEPSAAAVTTARGHALALAYAVALLPELKVVEVTFMAPAVAGWLRVAVQRLQQLGTASRCSSDTTHRLYRSCSSDSSSSSTSSDGSICSGKGRATTFGSSSSSDGSYPRVWEFTCIESVREAVQLLQDCKRSSEQASRLSSSSSSSSSHMNPACLETAVRCAANCSSRGRSTPMHTAAERGCARHVQVLLQAGAAVASRDTSGASPLFVAAEAGRAAAVEVLLRAGADPLLGNTAGETALYIAGR